PVLTFEVPLTEDELGVVSVEVGEVLGILFAEVVVVARDQVLDLEAVQDVLRLELLGRPRRRGRYGEGPGKAHRAKECPASSPERFHGDHPRGLLLCGQPRGILETRQATSRRRAVQPEVSAA